MKRILLFLGDYYFQNGKTGVGFYQGNIILGLKNDFDIVVSEEHFEMLPQNAHPIILSNIKRKLISLFKRFLPLDFFFPGYDIILIQSACFRHSKKTKQVKIIHDLMSFSEPYNYSLKQRLLHHYSACSDKSADVIIAVSQTTKQAIHEILRIEYNKIYVIPNITDFYVNNNPKDYFLFIGDMRKTKNLNSLIYGFSKYLKTFNGRNKLIIAGNKKFEYNNIKRIVEKEGIADKVIFKGYISEDEKKELFSNANAFVFLSDNEGFGIPLLEAAVNKIPVLCSDIPIFHEVLNEKYAIYTNNKSPSDIAIGLRDISKKQINAIDAEELKSSYSRDIFNKLLNQLIEKL